MSASKSTNNKIRGHIIRRKLRVANNSTSNEMSISKLDQELETIRKQKLKLDTMVKKIQKKKKYIIKKEYQVFVERLHTLPDELLSYIFIFTASCRHASKTEIVSVFNQREKLRKQWERWEQLPVPRQPYFSTFEMDNEYMNNHPDIDVYDISEACHNKNDPCSVSHIPAYSKYNGNITMGRVKIFVSYIKDTRVDDVNVLRRNSINETSIRNCRNINLNVYFSKTAWRGNNESGNYKQQKRHIPHNWVWGWGPVRVDTIKTKCYGPLSMAFFNDLWYPSHRSLFNQLTFICSGVNLDRLMKMLKDDGVDISNCSTRHQCYHKMLSA